MKNWSEGLGLELGLRRVGVGKNWIWDLKGGSRELTLELGFGLS